MTRTAATLGIALAALSACADGGRSRDGGTGGAGGTAGQGGSGGESGGTGGATDAGAKGGAGGPTDAGGGVAPGACFPDCIESRTSSCRPTGTCTGIDDDFTQRRCFGNGVKARYTYALNTALYRSSDGDGKSDCYSTVVWFTDMS